MRPVIVIVSCAAIALPAPAIAADVVFTGTLINSCVLNLTSPGVLAASSDGNTLSSENVGGVPAVLAVVAVGTNPTLSYTAPTLQSPATYSGTPVTAIRYQALGGASQPYTSNASSMTAGSLLDTVTINSRVTTNRGFASGTYTVRTTVTCQQ